MLDPITLSALGTAALTEGIKFLYGQAGEILKRWRERKDTTVKEGASQLAPTESVEIKLPSSIFGGQLSAPQIHFVEVERIVEPLRNLRKDLSDYAEGIEMVDTTDQNLLQRIDALRQILEAVYQERLTFKGEKRPSSGTRVEGKIDVEKLAGYAAAVHIGTLTGGDVYGTGEAKTVEKEGKLIGVDIDQMKG